MDETIAAAQKILGPKAKVPKPRDEIQRSIDEVFKIKKKYDGAVDALEKIILQLQNQLSSYKNALKQYKNIIDKSDFGLNKKDKDDSNKIGQAQKMLDKKIDDQMGIADENIKNLDELDKHMDGISSYKVETK